jgi:DHA1 family bicyclomycin/chloramphenicol resistance-like MFS transporter
MKHRILVVILASLSMMMALSIDAYLPALPTIARDYAVTLAAVQQTLTIYLFALAFMTLFYGTLSDSFGRRPVILISLGFYFISSLGAAWSPTLGWLLFFRLLQGLSAGAGMVIGRAIVGDLMSGAEAQRTMAYISLVFGVAPALAPILGGWVLAGWGWRSIFYFIAFFTFILFLACLRWLPESLPVKSRHPFHFNIIVRNYLEVGSHARFMLRSFSIALSFIGIMLYVASAPAYLLDLLHLTVKDFGWLFVTFIAGMTVGSAASGHLSHKLKPSAIIGASYALMLVSVLYSLVYTGLFAPRIPWAVIPHFFYGFGMSLGSPAMTVLTLELFPKVRGLPSSLQGFVFMICFSLISGAVAPLLYTSAFLLSVGAAVGLGLSFLLWWLSSRGQPEHAILSDDEQRLTEEAPHLSRSTRRRSTFRAQSIGETVRPILNRCSPGATPGGPTFSKTQRQQ